MEVKVPACWAETFGVEPVPDWLAEFDANPDKALDRFLTGEAYLGHLNIGDRDNVLAGFVERLADRGQFTRRLDEALVRWIQANWGRFERLRLTALAIAWQNAINVVSFSKLPGAANELYRHRDDLPFLTVLDGHGIVLQSYRVAIEPLQQRDEPGRHGPTQP